MRSPQFKRHFAPGYSLTDLLAIVAVLSVAGSLIFLSLDRAKRKARLAVCVANLQQVSRAVLMYAEHNRKTLPESSPTLGGEVWWWYKEQVKGYAGLTGASSANDTVFGCPDDRGYTDPKPFRKNARFDYGSYVFNGTTLPGTPNLAGWSVDEVKHPARSLLVMEWTAHAPLSWHQSRTGRANAPFYNDAQSVAGFVDGHVKWYHDSQWTSNSFRVIP